MRKLILLLFLFPVVFCLNCKKEGKKIPLSEEFRSYVDFPVGSYWIYKDTAVGTIDSIYVFENKNYWKEEYHPSNNYESLAIHTVHLSRNFSDTIYGQGYAETGYAEMENPLFGYHIALPKYGIMDILKFYTPNNIGDQGPRRGRPSIKSKDEIIEIQGTKYHNTVTTEFNTGGESYNGFKSEIYAQNVGVIRTVYADGHVFELIRYNINK